MKPWHASLLFAGLTLLTAHPATADERSEAVELAHEATQAYKAGQYVEALQKFEAAYRKFPAPAVVLNLARTELKLRHCQKALDYAQTYGEAFGQSSTAAVESPEALLSSVRNECPEVSIKSEPAGAAIVVEGLPETAFVTPWRGRLPVGSYTITARLKGCPDQHPPLTVASGALAQLHLTFVLPVAASVPGPAVAPPPLPVVTTLAVESSRPPPAHGTSRLLRNLGWGGLAIGAAALVAGVALGIVASADQSAVHTHVHPGSQAQSLLNTGNAEAAGADVADVGGGLLAAAGVGLAVRF